jgi:hypothetical protein
VLRCVGLGSEEGFNLARVVVEGNARAARGHSTKRIVRLLSSEGADQGIIAGAADTAVRGEAHDGLRREQMGCEQQQPGDSTHELPLSRRRKG